MMIPRDSIDRLKYTGSLVSFIRDVSKWLDDCGGRIVGMNKGEINVAFEAEDFKKLQKEVFRKEAGNG